MSVILFSPSDHKGIVVRQAGLLQADAIEAFLLEPDRGMILPGCVLLMEDILDVVGPIGVVRGGPPDGLHERSAPIFIF
jgi:hypothetical protein